MSPRKRSLRNERAPGPLSNQCRYLSAWCLAAVYSKSNRHAFESVKHEKLAPAPKKVEIQTSVNPQSVAQVAFGSNVPPVTLPTRELWNLPLTPASTVAPWCFVVSHAPGLWPAFVTNVPRSMRSSV